MKFYFAAPFEYREHLIPLVAWFHGRRFPTCTVTSMWLHLAPETMSRTSLEAADYALQDLADVDSADVLILFNPEGYEQSPGRNIEFGYALAKGKALWIVGRRKGVFQYLPHVQKYFTDIDHLKDHLTVTNDPKLYPYIRK